jgi:hypothetical protein
MTAKKKATASLHVLLAPEAPVGIVLRSGPAESVCAFLWDRGKDTFTAGQVLKGRLHGRRSDLSPDGKYLLYFAASKSPVAGTGGSWTAVSRAPWLKPLVLLGKGDAWHGGGLFTGKHSYWVNEGFGHRAIRNSPEVVRDMAYVPFEYYGGEDPGIYYLRLQRDGWELKRYAVVGEWHGCSIFEKPLPRGWVLRKLAHEEMEPLPGKGRYWEEHELEQESPARRVGCPDWEWADVDGPSVVWAEKGCLYRARISGPAGLGGIKRLKDFNSAKPAAGKPPY